MTCKHNVVYFIQPKQNTFIRRGLRMFRFSRYKEYRCDTTFISNQKRDFKKKKRKSIGVRHKIDLQISGR